jgi:para-nitrobenzyl esterase
MNWNRQTIALLAITMCLPSTLTFSAGHTDPLVVVTRDGAVRGVAGPGVRVWKGIPYAASPAGARRWMLPARPERWSGIRDASRYRSACPQVVRFALTEASDDEDCLYLNVAVPSTAPTGSNGHAVFIWIHGGAYVGGGANLYPLEYLARQANIIVVSINYRLGALGLMPHPAFEAAHNGGLGFEDQRLAMRWVQENIAAFGGDPRNVTIAGESAGASSVCMHLIAPERTAGLFHKAIIQSVACAIRQRTVAEGYAAGLALADAVGCRNDADALACLRRVPLAQLLEAQTALAARMSRAFSPSVGSVSVPRQPIDALASGQFVQVPLINGGTRDEMRLYVGYDHVGGAPVTPQNYAEKLRAIYGDKADRVLARYPLSAYSSAPSALGTAMSDFMPGGALSNCLFLHTARLAAPHVPIYQYEFTDSAAPPVMPDPGFEMGAVHSSELPYQFPNFSNKSVFDGPDLGPASQRLADQMAAYWGAFARSGRPQVDGLPAWKRFRSERAVFQLDPERLGDFDAGRAHHCDFWRQLYPRSFARRALSP